MQMLAELKEIQYRNYGITVDIRLIPEFLPCCIRHSTSNYYSLRTRREGGRSASTRDHKRFPRFIEDSLAFKGFLQRPEFIEVGVQRVRELSR
jgi:hypothetical protein